MNKIIRSIILSLSTVLALVATIQQPARTPHPRTMFSCIVVIDRERGRVWCDPAGDMYQIDDSQFRTLRRWIDGIGSLQYGQWPEVVPTEEAILADFERLWVQLEDGSVVRLMDAPVGGRPKLVLLNFERLGRWDLCPPTMRRIIELWREVVRDDTVFFVYDWHGVLAGVDQAAGLIDGRGFSCQVQDLPALPGAVPVLEPSVDLIDTICRMRELRHAQSLIAWTACSPEDVPRIVERMKAMEVVWESGTVASAGN